jgi:hypothetical protein
LSRRIKAVSSERERIRARERERLQAAQSKTSLRVKPSGLVKQLVETLNLSSWLSTEKAKMQLARPASGARERNMPSWRFVWRPRSPFFSSSPSTNS